ncbi:hypothetical protein AI2686V1_4503 [Klebsiella pneumoniae]|nr:hypothetical protein AI2686V1_4503 [Klebsiella pneumoniae]CAH3951888.1 hypothetical protein AI2686V1_4503 [Klebsiella pneumoniae]
MVSLALMQINRTTVTHQLTNRDPGLKNLDINGALNEEFFEDEKN